MPITIDIDRNNEIVIESTEHTEIDPDNYARYLNLLTDDTAMYPLQLRNITNVQQLMHRCIDNVIAINCDLDRVPPNVCLLHLFENQTLFNIDHNVHVVVVMDGISFKNSSLWPVELSGIHDEDIVEYVNNHIGEFQTDQFEIGYCRTHIENYVEYKPMLEIKSC